MCHFHAFWVGSNPTRNNFLRFLKQNNKRKKLWKNRKFRRNIGKSRRNIGIYRKLSGKIGKSRKFSGKIGQTKFLCIFLFEAHRKTIFRRNIGRKNRNFCPCSLSCRDMKTLHAATWKPFEASLTACHGALNLQNSLPCCDMTTLHVAT